MSVRRSRRELLLRKISLAWAVNVNGTPARRAANIAVVAGREAKWACSRVQPDARASSATRGARKNPFQETGRRRRARKRAPREGRGRRDNPRQCARKKVLGWQRQ